MKKYLYASLIGIVFYICLTTLHYCRSAQEYKAKYERADNNLRASEATANNLEKSNQEYWYTITELKNSKDSINQKLLEAAAKLKIKDKNITQMQYQTSVITKTDTITLKGDTIFKETMLPLDTVIGDKWYNTELKLRYPSTITVSPTFFSEKEVIVSKKKEYINKPSKIFFIRWFQKKREVIAIDVIENNPYIENGQNKFIKVVN